MGPERRAVLLPGRNQRLNQPRAGGRIDGGANNGAVHLALLMLGEGLRQRSSLRPWKQPTALFILPFYDYRRRARKTKHPAHASRVPYPSFR